jgi:hypothetical protein
MERTTSEQIHAVCVSLTNAGRQISRQVLAEKTRLSIGVIDDHVKRLVDGGRLRRVLAGVFELVEVFPPTRAISKTVLPNGLVKIEVDDQLIELYPMEAHAVGQMLAGEASQFTVLKGERDAADRVARLERELKELNARLAESAKRHDKLTATVKRLQNQSDLFSEMA